MQFANTSEAPLIYAALINTKKGAGKAVLTMLACARDDHAHLPREIMPRLHNGKGQESLGTELETFRREHAIRRTTTQGYDPSANPIWGTRQWASQAQRSAALNKRSESI